jgi:hypothetical protein
MTPTWQKWKEVASRITGFSTPFFGIEWQPPVLERDIAAKALTYIESRNVLDVSFEKEESPERTYYDAERNREELTKVMQEVSRDTAVFRQLDAIREACSIFRRRLREGKLEQYGYYSPIPDEVGKSQFLQALGGFRDACGRQIMLLCVTYGIDVPTKLVGCLPPPDPSG